MPEENKCLYKLIKINDTTNDTIIDFTEIIAQETVDVVAKNLGPGTYQIGVYVQDNTNTNQVSSCIGVILEPSELQVMVYNYEKLDGCHCKANVMVVGGTAPYKYYLNCKELDKIDSVYYCKCDCGRNKLKVVDSDGCEVVKYLK